MGLILAATILAIGAHAGDVELTSGAVLLHQHLRGDRIVILHLTLGEGGNPKMSPADYGAQKSAKHSRSMPRWERKRSSRHIAMTSCPTTAKRGDMSPM